MKRLFFRLLTLPMLWLSLAACAPHPDAADVRGDAETRIPVQQADGSYKMEIVKLTGLDSLFELTGKFARFFLSPRILDGRLDGMSPRGHFVKSGSLYVASDELSLQLVTVYAHMQKFAALDSELGVGGVNKWPRDIGVAVRVTGGMTNNAFYDGDTDAMLFVPYVGGDLPIPVNAGILAHEHFHSLFYKLVMEPLQKAGMVSPDTQGSAHSQSEFYKLVGLRQKGTNGDVLTDATQEQLYYHLLLIRGMNEGLADFWGWMYTSNPNFIAMSLPDEGTRRNMQVAAADREISFRIPTAQMLRGRIRNWGNNPKQMTALINEHSYSIGTVYARIFKAYADARAEARGQAVEVARKDVARTILKTLPQMRNDLLVQGQNEYYAPARLLKSFTQQAGEMKKQECELMSEALNVNSEGLMTYKCEQQGESFVMKSAVVTAPTVTVTTTTKPFIVAPPKATQNEPVPAQPRTESAR